MWKKTGVTSSSKIQFESNSQLVDIGSIVLIGCYQFLKDTIWKQFTTQHPLYCYVGRVLPVPQRYNLKAIHNWRVEVVFHSYGVTSSSKIQFESNSQPNALCNSEPQRCYQFLKDTIWKQFTTPSWTQPPGAWVLPVPQRYNLKAIHNLSSCVTLSISGVTSSSKIQFESNSQLSTVS